jgi:hypothetical protein
VIQGLFGEGNLSGQAARFEIPPELGYVRE